jgi:hypothetical protein
MIFSAKAGCKAATTSEITLAARQNALASFQWFGQDLESNVIKAQKSSNVNSKGSLLISSLVFCALGLAAFVHTTNMKQSRRNGDMSVTLMDGNPDVKPKQFHQNIAGKNKMSVLNTNGNASGAQPTEDLSALHTPPADIQSVKTGKSLNSTARSKIGSGIFEKLSAALSFKDGVSEKVNLEVKYVEKSVDSSQYEPPSQKLTENMDGDAKTQDCDNAADQSNCDSIVRTAQLHTAPCETLSILALDENGEQSEEKLKGLVCLFPPDGEKKLTTLDFVKSYDGVYRKFRTFRAAVSNSSVLNNAYERIVDVIFYFLMLLLVLSILGYNVVQTVATVMSVVLSFSFAFGPAVSKFTQVRQRSIVAQLYFHYL